MSGIRVGVIGAAIHPVVADAERRSLEEIIYDAVQECLRDAGVTPADYDGIVVASNDQYDGRAISVMAASGSIGGVDRDVLSTPSAAEHAFVMGALRVASGQFETQLVVSWGPLEAGSQADVERLAADPYYHRALPQDDLSGQALQASAMLSAMPWAADLAHDILVKNRANGGLCEPEKGRMRRWPLHDGMIAPRTTGIVALFLASEAFIEARGIGDPAWIGGLGWATEASFLGDRDLTQAPALVAAAGRAYAQAGITDPTGAFDLAEVADATAYQELLAYEALGFADRADWQARVDAGSFGPDGDLPVNLSGGALCRNPMFCAGLVAIGEVVNQVRGRAGRHQCADVRQALAHAASGIAMQYQTVVVLRSTAGAVA